MFRIVLYLFLVLIYSSLHAQKPTVVASASMMADMAQNIVGDLMEVKYVVPRGQDPHLYKPTPGDVILVEDAALVLINGLTFEGWLGKLIANSDTKAPIVTITDGITPIQSEKYKNSFDPHAWMDANLALTYIKNILESVVKLDPENETIYRSNHDKYVAELIDLDRYIKKQIQSIPEKQRILITSHDAFAYFGKRYGLQLEAIMGISTEAEVQSSDIIRVHKAISESNIPAIFMESTINPKILQQIAKDKDIIIGGELYADSLGEEGSPGDTYLKMLRHNADVIVQGLTRQVTEDISQQKDKTSINPIVLYGLLGIVLIYFIIYVIRKLNNI